ncbi:hypothetical protein GCM10023339_06170 [Alloalcanivorax gelatiniphagus]
MASGSYDAHRAGPEATTHTGANGVVGDALVARTPDRTTRTLPTTPWRATAPRPAHHAPPEEDGGAAQPKRPEM